MILFVLLLLLLFAGVVASSVCSLPRSSFVQSARHCTDTVLLWWCVCLSERVVLRWPT